MYDSGEESWRRMCTSTIQPKRILSHRFSVISDRGEKGSERWEPRLGIDTFRRRFLRMTPVLKYMKEDSELDQRTILSIRKRTNPALKNEKRVGGKKKRGVEWTI